MPNTNKIRLYLIYAVIFIITFAIGLIIIRNDYTVSFTAELTNLKDDYFVIYKQNDTYSRFHVIPDNNSIQYDIPLGASELNLMAVTNLAVIRHYFDSRDVAKERIINTDGQIVNKEQVLGTYINNQPVDILKFHEIMRAEKARLLPFFIVESIIIGFCAVLFCVIGFTPYKRKNIVDPWLLNLRHKIAFRTNSRHGLFSNRTFKAGFLLILAVVILFWRRPDQFLQPYIFFEDGTFILDEYMRYGLASIFDSVNGYSILSSRLLNILAHKISFWYYPEIASIFANLFIILVIFAIAYSPTHLKKPYWCAIMALLVKTSSECFGVLLYSFWWAGLLLMLALLWQNDRKALLRMGFIVFGGLSSPMIMTLLPLFIFLAIYTRHKNDILAAVIAFCAALFQFIKIISFSGNASSGDFLTFEIILNPLRNYLGSFFFLSTHSYHLLTVCGAILLIIMLVYGLKWRQNNLKTFISQNLYYLLLLLLLGGSIASIVLRIPVSLGFNIHPLQPEVSRYYFYTYILLAWISIWIVTTLPWTYPKIIIKTIMVLVLFNFLLGGAYKAMPEYKFPISWRGQLAECIATGDLLMPMAQSSAFNNMSEFYMMRRQDCIRMMENSIFYNDVNKNINAFLKKHPDFEQFNPR